MGRRIAFQGEPGANSDLACRSMYPEMEPLPCPTFEDAFAAVESGSPSSAMIPIENSIAGRVADIHHLLPHSQLQSWASASSRSTSSSWRCGGHPRRDPRSVHSHIHALGQCRRIIRSTAGRGGRRRHRGRRPRGRRAGRRHRGRAGAPNGRRAVRARHPGRGRGGRAPQHDPFRGAVDPPARPGRQRADGHLVRVPGAQRRRRRSTRPWAASRPTASTSPSSRATSSAAPSSRRSSTPRSRAIRRPVVALGPGGAEYFSVELRFLGTYPAEPVPRRDRRAPREP